jgi:hypothetical protein
MRELRARLAAARAACLPRGATSRSCRAEAKQGLRDGRRACGREHRERCLSCCTAGGGACGQRRDVGLRPTYDVTYNEGTALVDEATMRDRLLGRSEDGITFRFAAATEAVRQLVPGQVVIFASTALRRVTAVSDTGAEIVVDTEPATLADAVRRGTFGWTYGVAWDQVGPAALADAVPLAGRSVAAARRAGFTPQAILATYSGNLLGWDVEFGLGPGPGRLDITLTASRSLAGTKVAGVSGTGWISGFTDEVLLTYEESTPQRMTRNVIGLEGEMELEWHAFKPNDQGLTEIAQFTLPVKLPITFLVGPVPVTISVGASLQVVPELRVDGASSGGKFKVTFRSDQGFSIDDAVQSPSGTLHAHTAAQTGETGSAGWGVVGFGLGVEFPRLSVSLFGDTAMAFVTLKTYTASLFTPGTTLTNDIPPCQQAFTDLFAAAGWELAPLGWKLGGDTVELWRAPRYEVFGGDGTPCSITG